MELGGSCRKVVIDAGAAIKLQRLERLGTELFTTSGVLSEVRDEKARALLRTLPIELRVREPLPQDIIFVKQFAKLTGDFGFLSHNDTALIALTIQLHREAGGTVRERPAPLTTEDTGTAPFDWAPARADKATGGPGPPVAPPTAAPEAPVAEAGRSMRAWDMLQTHELGTPLKYAALRADPSQAIAAQEGQAGAVDREAAAPPSLALPAAAVPQVPREPEPAQPAPPPPIAQEGASVAEEHDEDNGLSEDGSSAGEWVTADNMHRFGVGVQPSSEVKVTCATADYSVQNVLLQMGITPLTFDGYAVRSVKLWGLVCRACFFFTRETQKVFCPKCGHDTLVRVPIVVDQDGRPTVLSAGRKLRTKGTIYSVPKPRGGRGWKPIFAEDEIKIGGRDRELRRLENLHNKERESKDPFNEDNGARGWWQRGTTSTGKTILGDAPRLQAGYGRRNPNAGNFGGFRTKKR